MASARLGRLTRVVLAAIACIVLLSPGMAAGQSEPGQVTLQDIDTSAYPDVSLRVSIPPALIGADAEPVFEVLENSSQIDGVEVAHVRGETEPANVVLLMDASGSMAGEPLENAKAAATAFFAALGENASVAILAFNDRTRLLSGFTDDDARLRAAVSDLSASGETALYDGVVAAADLVSGASAGQRAIVVLSDGGDTVSANSFERAMSALTQTGVPVYAVALESDEYNPHALSTMAAGSSGRLMSAEESVELASLFEGIANEIRGAYILSYTSARPRTKDIELDVSVVFGDERLSASAAYANPLFAWQPSAEAAVVAPSVSGDPVLLLGIGALAFLSVTLLVVGATTLLFRQPTGMDQLQFYDQLHAQSDRRSSAVTDQVRDRMVSAVAAVAGKRGFTELFSQRLERAGLPLRPTEYMTLHIVLVVGIGLLAQLTVGNLAFSFLVVVGAALGPLLALDIAVARRRRAFDEQLPDVLNMIAGSLRGGWGLSQALDFVVQQSGPPAAVEFRRVLTESRLGMPLEQALELMADRVDSPEFRSAVSAMNIQRDVGGNLAEILDIVSETVRQRAAFKRHVHALTAEGRISAVILALLPVIEIMALLVISPTYLVPMVTTPFGLFMTGGSILLVMVGAFWLRAVTRIEV